MIKAQDIANTSWWLHTAYMKAGRYLERGKMDHKAIQEVDYIRSAIHSALKELGMPLLIDSTMETFNVSDSDIKQLADKAYGKALEKLTKGDNND